MMRLPNTVLNSSPELATPTSILMNLAAVLMSLAMAHKMYMYNQIGDFPGSLVVKALCFPSRGTG